MQGFAIIVKRARAGQGDLGVSQQVRQGRAQLVGDVGGKRRKTLEGIVQAPEHGIEGLGQFSQFDRHLRVRQACGQRARRYAGRHFAHASQRAQAAACGPGAKQGGGQGREADGQPDQLLHARKKMLVVSDVQQQGQAHRILFAGLQRRVEAAVVSTVDMQGADARVGGRDRQVGLAVEPELAVAAADAQGQVGLVAQLGLQGGQALRQCATVVDTFQQLAQYRQLAGEQLLVQFDEVGFAGTAEQYAGQQRDDSGAGGEQQGQAAAQGQATHQAPRSSST
ncbi:hypothetical protein D3C85_1207860 [compost metagenome]